MIGDGATDLEVYYWIMFLKLLFLIGYVLWVEESYNL
jgi:hypothetical protein